MAPPMSAKIELTLATIEHEAEVARLASTEAQEAFQTFVDANKKQPAANGGDAKPAEQKCGGGQMWFNHLRRWTL